jgi:hypothetical protein
MNWQSDARRASKFSSVGLLNCVVGVWNIVDDEICGGNEFEVMIGITL